MQKYLYIIASFLCVFTYPTHAQDLNSERIKKYIQQYYPLAINEQIRTGIPASVTLAQAIHETDAGTSILMTKANNHFGLKCKKDWTGPTFIHSDDAPNECFKKYSSAEQSFKDHSDHLKNNARYEPLFKLSKTDYAGWAIGLKKNGYATNNAYSVKLIKLIEDYHLQEYTYAAMKDDTDAKYYPKTNIVIPVPQPQADSEEEEDTTIVENKKEVSIPTNPTKNIQPKNDQKKPIIVVPENETVVSTIQQNADSAKQIILVKDKSAVNITNSGSNHLQLTDVPQTFSHPVVTTTVTPTTSLTIAAEKFQDTAIMVSKATENVPPASAPKNEKPLPVKKMVPRKDSGKIITLNGLKAFYAYKGEMLLKYAVKYKIHYAHLLEINDLTDSPLPDDMPIYIEKKLITGTRPQHLVTSGENMQIIAQLEGIQIKKLYALNKMVADEEPETGELLQLQKPAPHKPNTYSEKALTKEKSRINPSLDNKQTEADFVNVDHKTPLQKSSQQEKENDAPKNIVPVVEKNSKKNANKQQDDANKEDLTGLKEELDKVVYSDNPKIKPANTIPTEKQVVKEQKVKAVEPIEEVQEELPKKKETKKTSLNKTKPKKPKNYTIKKGDTLGGIANKFDVSVKELKKWNNLKNENIREGKQLKISK